MGMIPIDLLDDGDRVSEIGERVALWVIRQGAAKEVAREFSVSPKTVESWRGGNPPQFKHLVAMTDKWGDAFLMHIFAPVLDLEHQTMIKRLERVKADITIIENWAGHLENSEHQTMDSQENGAVSHQSGGTAHECSGALGLLGKGIGKVAGTIMLAIILSGPLVNSVFTNGINGDDPIRVSRGQRHNRTFRTGRSLWRLKSAMA